MKTQWLGVIIGGLIPAITLGIFGVLLKKAGTEKIGAMPLLLTMGFAVVCCGLVAGALPLDRTWTGRGSLWAGLAGIIWAVSQALIVLAVTKYEIKISRLVPLFNMNTLVAVLLGLAVLGEWRDINAIRLTVGALLVTAGGIVVALA